MGRLTSRLTTPTTRIQGNAVWEIVQFLLNSALFVLVGLQLPGDPRRDRRASTRRSSLLDGALIAGDRDGDPDALGLPVHATCPGCWSPRAQREPAPPWRNVLLVAWTGMRGAVSLAAALALPLMIDGGGAFPERDLIIFLTFSVILVTLLLQGFTLPPLIQLLGVDDTDEALELEELQARQRAAEAALARLEELTGEEWVTRRHRRAGPRRLHLPPAALLGADRRRRRRERGLRGALGVLPAADARAARGPALDPDRACGTMARSTTRSCASSSASSTSKTPAWRSEARMRSLLPPPRRVALQRRSRDPGAPRSRG